MRFSTTCAALAALSGSILIAGCSKKDVGPMPASPVAVPLSDFQSIELAENYLDAQGSAGRARSVHSVEPMGDGNLVTFHTAFDGTAKPPVASRMVMVEHDGSVRELTFREGE